ncbi:PfkB family carbohydrate kinase [Leucobacter sp. USHLN153]|uniref:PfkB family carbohydrate kinase n=1 Tax=Leucobacter sp. USHLN153 TaxID=3081268 RepID=UPI0030181DC0
MTEQGPGSSPSGTHGNGIPSVTVVGSVNLDTTVRVPHIPVAGETILATDSTTSPGGKGANQAAAAAAAGAAVRFIGAMGADPIGDAALEGLRAFGVELDALQRVEGVPSGSATVVVADDAENLILVSPGANAHLDPETVAQALSSTPGRVLLTQLETPITVLEACSAAPFTRRILNPAPISRDPRLPELLQNFTLLVPNRTELAQLTNHVVPRTIDEVRECVASLHFAGDVVVTLGADGAAIFPAGYAADGSGAQAPRVIAPPLVTPIDTTGAGDVFCGTLARQLAEHDDLERAVVAAVEASAHSTEIARAQLAPTLTAGE